MIHLVQWPIEDCDWLIMEVDEQEMSGTVRAWLLVRVTLAPVEELYCRALRRRKT